MKILFTGKSDFKYNRVRVLLAGLAELQDIELCFFPIKSKTSFDKKAFIAKQNEVDFIYIPPFRHIDVRFIKKFSTKPIVFDPLISKYLTKAVDYRHFWKGPIKYWLDKIPFDKCDILLADTQAHKDYFVRKFSIASSKIGVLPIGVDTSLFQRNESYISNNALFRVGFYGSFVPLQGMPKIIEVANILKDENDIVFDIIGSGYDYNQSIKLIKKYKLENVNLLGWADYEVLSSMIAGFDVCLGIFGDSEKADSVIPNKVFHYASLGKCIISKNTKGINELFTHNLNIVLSDNSPQKIAEQIRSLKANRAEITRIGNNAHDLITRDFNHVEIAKRFIAILEKYRLEN